MQEGWDLSCPRRSSDDDDDDDDKGKAMYNEDGICVNRAVCGGWWGGGGIHTALMRDQWMLYFLVLLRI